MPCQTQLGKGPADVATSRCKPARPVEPVCLERVCPVSPVATVVSWRRLFHCLSSQRAAGKESNMLKVSHNMLVSSTGSSSR